MRCKAVDRADKDNDGAKARAEPKRVQRNKSKCWVVTMLVARQVSGRSSTVRNMQDGSLYKDVTTSNEIRKAEKRKDLCEVRESIRCNQLVTQMLTLTESFKKGPGNSMRPPWF